MLKSCTYCGKIHDSKFTCPQKKKALEKRARKRNDMENKFRWGRPWKKKATEIKERDKYLCQICIRNLHNTTLIYNPHDLSVHHIKKLRDDYSRRLDNYNLLTLCREHHELAECGDIETSLLLSLAAEQEEKNNYDGAHVADV